MKKYLYLILFFLVCVPAIAGTINSYTLKSPPDDADTIVIYDSDDGSTKKTTVGDISGSGTAGINWSSYPDLTALTSAQEFLINNAGTSSSINWEVVQTQIPNQGWTDNGTVIYNTTTSDFVGIGTSSPTAALEIRKNGSERYLRISSAPNLDGDVLQINPSGNVGIGTIDYGAKLWVSSTAGTLIYGESRAATSSSGGAGITLNSDDGAAMSAGDQLGVVYFSGASDAIRTKVNSSAIVSIATDDWGGTTPSSIQFQTSATGAISPRVTINENGNVGIGTHRPSARLETIKSSVVTTAPLMMLSSSLSSKGDYMIVGSAGNVGIGTISPISKLEVNGLIVPDKVTADPCTAGQEGAVFYNDTSNYWCGCNGTDDVKLTDNTTACF